MIILKDQFYTLATNHHNIDDQFAIIDIPHFTVLYILLVHIAVKTLAVTSQI